MERSVLRSVLVAIFGVLLVALQAHAAPKNPGYAVKMRTSIVGNDVDCGQTDSQGKALPYCSISGSVTAVADACDANPDCTSFVMQGYSGYLKTGGTPVYTEGYSTFCKLGTKGCSGAYTMLRRTDIKGADINCNYKDYNGRLQSYCQLNGDLSSQISACNDNPQCKAFTIQSDYQGYLKASKPSSPPLYREGYVTYVKNN